MGQTWSVEAWMPSHGGMAKRSASACAAKGAVYLVPAAVLHLKSAARLLDQIYTCVAPDAAEARDQSVDKIEHAVSLMARVQLTTLSI